MIDIRADLSHILSDLAARERRTVSQQAAYMLEQTLLCLARTQAAPTPTPVPTLGSDEEEDAC
jgi:hypothetical protein